MYQMPPGAGAWNYLLPIVLIGVVILRNMRPRTLRVERLWISPALILVATAMMFRQAGPSGPIAIAIDVVAFALGALLGWWRGRASRFTIDPVSHVVTSKVSAWGMILILGILVLRYALRGAMAGEASVLHVTAADIADSFLVLALGVVSAQRIEWWIRARRMIGEARARLN